MAASFWRNMGRAPCLMEMGASVREAEMLAAERGVVQRHRSQHRQPGGQHLVPIDSFVQQLQSWEGWGEGREGGVDTLSATACWSLYVGHAMLI